MRFDGWLPPRGPERGGCSGESSVSTARAHTPLTLTGRSSAAKFFTMPSVPPSTSAYMPRPGLARCPALGATANNIQLFGGSPARNLATSGPQIAGSPRMIVKWPLPSNGGRSTKVTGARALAR
jgi:hypothetical protein